jgi:hypothetical protein
MLYLFLGYLKMKETTENTLKEWSPKGDRISFQDGMNGALHSTTNSPNKEKHQGKKPEKNNHNPGKRPIPDK